MKIMLPYLVIIASFFPTCLHEEKPTSTNTEVPAHISELEKLSINSLDQSPKYEVTVEIDQVFTETEDVFFGYAHTFDVDEQGRLFLEAGTEMGKASILAFNPDGSFIGTIGRYGRGPGEFEVIYDVKTDSDYLYVLEDFEIQVFRLKDLIYSHTIGIEMESIGEDSELRGLRPRGEFFISRQNIIILNFLIPLPQKIKGGEQFKYYSTMNSAGVINSKPFLKLRDFSFFNTSIEKRLPDPLPFTMPFSRSTLICIGNNGHIYNAWNENFLIKVHDLSGNYVRSIYFSYSNTPLSKGEALALVQDKKRRDVLLEETLPDSWPALNSLHVDEAERLWISTITENDESMQWWVLSDSGHVLANFEMPGTKSERQVWHPEDIVIKDEFIYLIEQTHIREASKIIKYKINFRGRNKDVQD